MDHRRHGKRPLPLEASPEEKEKEQDNNFPAWTTHESDMSAMVSALTQVIGTTTTDADADPSPAAVKEESSDNPLQQTQTQTQDQDQGTFIYNSLILSPFNWFVERVKDKTQCVPVDYN